MVELLAKAERVEEIRKLETLKYDIDEKKLAEVAALEDQIKEYYPDAFDDHFRGLNRTIFESDQQVKLVDPYLQEKADALMDAAIERLATGELHSDTPMATEELTNLETQSKLSLAFQGQNLQSALDGQESSLMTAIKEAKQKGSEGNLHDPQHPDFFSMETSGSDAWMREDYGPLGVGLMSRGEYDRAISMVAAQKG